MTSLGPLSLAVRLPVLAKYTGELAVGISALVGVPLLVAIATRSWSVAIVAGVVFALLLGGGGRLSRIPVASPIQRNEALVVTASAFVLAALSLVPIFVVSGVPLLDATFEAVSGITTTGLTTLATVEDRTVVFLFTRAWAQWFGGLAIIVWALAIIVQPGAAARLLGSPLDRYEELVGGTRARARRALGIYALMTAVAFAALWLVSGQALAALFHALTAVSTGGFSSFNDSLEAFGFRTQLVAVLCGLAGAVSLSVYHRLGRGAWRTVWHDETLRALLISVMIAVVVLVFTMSWGGAREWRDVLRHASVLGISAHSTTGYTNMPLTDLDAASKLAMVVFMSVGGDIGSTAGGVKVLRAVVVGRFLWLTVVRTALPSHAVTDVRADGHRVTDEDVRADLSLVLLFASLLVLSWFPFLLAGYRPIDSLFEVTSALGTVGLSTGITAPELPGALKLLLCADMLLGRLEIVAILVLLYPRTWFGRRAGAT